MTAEIGIMNRHAIALAADSAVTVQRGNDSKIYNSANKLFMLSKYHPVGIMLYGNADFMGVPWEIIIKDFRNKLGNKKFSKLEGYANDFIRKLSKNTNIIPMKVQNKYCKNDISNYIQGLSNNAKHQINTQLKCGGDEKEVYAIVSGIIENEYNFIIKYPFLDSVKAKEQEKFNLKYKKFIDKTISEHYQKIPLKKKHIKQLHKAIQGRYLRKCLLSNVTSGIVVAGFGDDDYSPSCIALQVERKVNNILKYNIFNHAKIDSDCTASIMPFAQREMVDTFIQGIDPNLQKFSDSYLEPLFHNLAERIITQLFKKPSKKTENLKKELTASIIDTYNDYESRIANYRQTEHVSPIINIVEVLPKDELASMAEALVNLTSFKRRVSNDAETVGGPIDVAVISKGDGFVWIKRKHYFTPELNHHFFKNYYNGESTNEKRKKN